MEQKIKKAIPQNKTNMYGSTKTGTKQEYTGIASFFIVSYVNITKVILID